MSGLCCYRKTLLLVRVHPSHLVGDWPIGVNTLPVLGWHVLSGHLTTPGPLFLDIERHVETELNETKEFYKKKQKISAVEKKGKVFCLLPLEKHFFPPRETNYLIIARWSEQQPVLFLRVETKIFGVAKDKKLLCLFSHRKNFFFFVDSFWF